MIQSQGCPGAGSIPREAGGEKELVAQDPPLGGAEGRPVLQGYPEWPGVAGPKWGGPWMSAAQEWRDRGTVALGS